MAFIPNMPVSGRVGISSLKKIQAALNHRDRIHKDAKLADVKQADVKLADVMNTYPIRETISNSSWGLRATSYNTLLMSSLA